MQWSKRQSIQVGIFFYPAGGHIKAQCQTIWSVIKSNILQPLLKSKQQGFFFSIYLINQNFNFHSTVNTTETSSLSKINLQSSTFHFQLTTGLEPSPSDISVHFSKKTLGFYLFKTYHRSLIKPVFLFLKPNQNSTSYIYRQYASHFSALTNQQKLWIFNAMVCLNIISETDKNRSERCTGIQK